MLSQHEATLPEGLPYHRECHQHWQVGAEGHELKVRPGPERQNCTWESASMAVRQRLGLSASGACSRRALCRSVCASAASLLSRCARERSCSTCAAVSRLGRMQVMCQSGA